MLFSFIFVVVNRDTMWYLVVAATTSFRRNHRAASLGLWLSHLHNVTT
jgi:hypothetical protein